jgi:transcriptional regulator of acetoin/glycerol metabolism
VLPEDETTDGVCVKCYRHFESVIKLEAQKENLKKQIIESWRKVHTLMLTPSSKSTRRVTQKRLLTNKIISLRNKKLFSYQEGQHVLW